MEKEEKIDENNKESFWAEGSFTQSISMKEFGTKKDTFSKSHNEDTNFNCKKCNQKISAHNKDWHDEMCDDCFNKTYFSEEYKEIESLVEKLKKYDNKEGYKLEYEDVKKKLEPAIKKLAYIGKMALEFLHPILKNEDTWSCLFALEILNEIKDEQSIPYLIEFIEKNEFGDYFENCSEASHVLVNIGVPAVESIIQSLEKGLENKIHYCYLSETLSKIRDKRGNEFRLKVLKDFLNNPEHYKDWFNLVLFICDFNEDDKEALPYLKKLKEMNLTEEENRELKSAIEFIENPREYEKKEKIEIKRIKELLNKSKKRKIGRNELCLCGSGKKYKKCCL